MNLTPAGEWNTSYLDDEVQWDDSDDDASFGANVCATNYTQSDDVFDSVLSELEHKAPRIAFSDDVAFIKGATEDEFFFDILELGTYKFDNYDGFSTSTAIAPFGPNYIHTTTHYLISSSSSIAAIIPAAYTIVSLVC